MHGGFLKSARAHLPKFLTRPLTLVLLATMVSVGVGTAVSSSLGASPTDQPVPGHTRLVPPTPRTNVPIISDGQITDLEYIGNRIFIAGTFTSIKNNTSTNKTVYAQKYVASYNIDTGLVDTGFKPVIGGGTVTEIEASPDGTKLFIAGTFSTIGGVTKRKFASINPTTGAVVSGWTANANSAGTALAVTNTTVYLGGQFTTINNVAHGYLAAVSATTGALIPAFQN